MAIQSSDELIRVVDEWFRNFCPPNLVKDGPQGTKNAELILGRCFKKHGIVSISGMTESANELAPEGKLALIPEPPAPRVKTSDEIAAEKNAKMHADYMKTIAPQESFDEKVARDKQKRLVEERAKAQSTAKGDIELAISGYECYRENGFGVDYATTDAMVRTLAVVRQIIQELPDHPKMGDVTRVAERLNARLK